MKPKITIVIATYNSGRTLKKALDSVMSLTYQDWECLLVDGMSNDNTLNIIKEYVEIDDRFRYISEKDTGIYDAFNKGWRNARGEWVLYLGSDDQLTPDGITALMTVKATDEAILSGSVFLIKPDGSIKNWKSVGYEGNHQAKITKRSLLEKLGGYDISYKICADSDFHVRLKNAGYKVLNIDEPIAYFSMDGISSDFSYVWTQTKERYKIYSKDRSVKSPFIKTFYVMSFNIGSFIYRKLLGILNKM